MILLSKLIKSQNTFKDDNEKHPIAVQAIQELLKDKYKDIDEPDILIKNSHMIQTAKEEAEQIKQSALAETSRILQQVEYEKGSWEQEKEQLYEQVRQEGYAEGLELGRQEALRQYQTNIEESQRIIDMAKKDYDETVQLSENAILLLATKIASKIIAMKLDESSGNFLAVVKEGLSEVKEYENIKVHVHPTHYEFLLSQKDELKLLLTNKTDISIYANTELDSDGCFIDSAFGRIDISIDTQLKQLKDQLMQLIDER